MKKLEITVEKVKQAALENPLACSVLESLFPEVFEDAKIFCKIGVVFIRSNIPNNLYTIFKWNGEVRILNITQNSMWNSNSNLKVSDLADPEGSFLNISEFKKLVGYNNLAEFKIIESL